MGPEQDGSHSGTNPLAQQTPMSESAFLSHIVRNGPDLDSNLLLGASSLEPSGPISTPQPNSFGSNPDFSFDQAMSGRSLSIDIPPIPESWSPSASQFSRGCDLFFAHISHFVPFLHRPTLDTDHIAAHLLLSMLCLAYQYGEDPDCGDEPGSGASLSERCFHQARLLMASDDDTTSDLTGSTQYVTVVQSYLLLQIYAMMYLCGDGSNYGLKIHSKMITLARAGGLMQPIVTDSSTTEDLDSLWRDFVRAESHKRTLFAVHQIDSLWYQFLSIPRRLSHLEIKHDLPCPEDHWSASSSVEWAHRQLVARSSGASQVRYSDAVRRFVSSDTDLESIPAFDPYGAINITQFLVSSAREISGWSTMTGMLSVERLGPLRSSLVALGPFIRPQTETTNPPHTALCAATWEAAMIEVQMWSQSHTGGIVEGSIDAVLHQMTYLAPSCEILCESNTAKDIQQHVDWFLRYLDETPVTNLEAPWITLYAYKAFILAWQLVRRGHPGSMEIVGVQDGNVEGALVWARKVFGRRQRWQLGKVIMTCLDTLDNDK